MSDSAVSLSDVVALAKRRGFVYPTSSIYGGLANSYDYGPMGAELLRNIRNAWWEFFIHRRADMVGIDSQIMLHPQTWVASGHVNSFNDPLVEDTITHKRYRADHLIEEESVKVNNELKEVAGPIRNDLDYQNYFRNYVIPGISFQNSVFENIRTTIGFEILNVLINFANKLESLGQDSINVINYITQELALKYQNLPGRSASVLLKFIENISKDGNENEKPILVLAKAYYFNSNIVQNLSLHDVKEVIRSFGILSPEGNPVTQPKLFNLLFESHIGAVSGEKGLVYLRGETAQGIFTNFRNILDSTRVALPFGVGQIGKSFRNEITTGQFIFRTLEFEQGEIEYFFDPAQSNWEELMQGWKDAIWEFVTITLGIDPTHLRWRQHTDQERSHYSKDTYDLEYEFPFGWKELWGLAYRTDYDLKQHIQHSGESLEVVNPETGGKIVPHVIEPAVGFGRLFLMVLQNSYAHDDEHHRTLLRLPAALAPTMVAVFPLVKNKPELVEKARELFTQLQARYTAAWDDRGNIGKRYLYQDEVGTPFCLTVDYQTLEDNTVTLRERNSTQQRRLSLDEVDSALQQGR